MSLNKRQEAFSIVRQRTVTSPLPGHSIPCNIRQVEDQVFGLIILWPSQYFRPVLQICPSLLWRAAAERRKTSKEFEKYAT